MDLSFLKPLYRRPGPFVSVYAELLRPDEDAAKAAELRWRALRAELSGQGAADRALAAADRAVAGVLRDRRTGGLAVFAAADGSARVEALDVAPSAPVARAAPLPHVVPYLAARGERVPYLVAVVDRRGGEIDCVSAAGVRRRIDVPGEPEPRGASGRDRDEARAQRSAETVWRGNARRVGRALDRAARRHRAEAVVVAGDVRARTAVLEEVSEGVLSRTVESDRGCGPGLDSDVARVLELKAAERVFSVAERFERELARGERAVAGLPATVAAVRDGRVASLLLDDPDAPAHLWVGPEPDQIAATRDELLRRGVPDPVEDRADAALVRGVAATDGELVVLPSDGPNAELGVGAVLRYPDPS
ncbi:hypothetical protein BTM25_23010 [Actinomadura rubteroloni]|uniref:Peptide chain release factor 1 n=1 Tax=Actinomadura rubteroloni TaxID=1926885 RepID=A0A2P4US50_9ACTN|nr:peptide chain release factor 1 [Actinomadura rubteroloni]POM27877.1 hypothetical protein BTM25_23010 [Actinomadura rubteroloni]